MPDEVPGTRLWETTLTRAELVDFARVVGETRAIYFDETAARRAGYPDVLAAPTYLFCLMLRPEDPWAWARHGGLDMTRTLHGEQSFTYHRLAHAGDRLTLAASVTTSLPTRPGVRRLSRRTTVSSPAGCVATLDTILVMKEVSR